MEQARASRPALGALLAGLVSTWVILEPLFARLAPPTRIPAQERAYALPTWATTTWTPA